jgi:anti-sigma factor RsiW
MTASARPSEAQIQDYIDGRLVGRDLAAMRAYLFDHPEIASKVETLLRHNEALKRLGQVGLDEPIPERLRQVVRRPARNGAQSDCARRLFMVVTATLLIWVGAPPGGFASGGTDPGPHERPSPTALL